MNTDFKDQNDTIIKLIKHCIPFIISDNSQIMNKFSSLHLLNNMWDTRAMEWISEGKLF